MDLRKGVGAVCQVGGCRIGRKVLKNPDTTSQRSEVKVSMLVATGVDSHSVRMHLMSLVVQGTARYVRFFCLWDSKPDFSSGSYLVGSYWNV